MKPLPAAISLQGRSHTRNEDHAIASPRYAVVADGMGGVSGGEIASAMAVDIMSAAMAACIEQGAHGSDIDDALSEAIIDCSKQIQAYAAQYSRYYGMGTTVVAAVIDGKTARVAWCGDSRCYIYNKKRGLRLVTTDHSAVQEMVDAGQITPEEAFTHPDANLLTRYVGDSDTQGTCQPETTCWPIAPGDTIILCSDGLSGYCREAQIEAEARAASNPGDLCQRLANLALASGSDDDITIAAITLKPTLLPW